jgi:hypothetical protein
VFALQEWTSQAFPGNKSTTKFQLSDHRKCQQYWDDKCLSHFQLNVKMKMYKEDVRDYMNINSHLDIDLEKYSHGNKYKMPKIDHPVSTRPSPSLSSSTSPPPSTPLLSDTPTTLLSSSSTPASSQSSSQYSTITPQTLEDEYSIDCNTTP